MGSFMEGKNSTMRAVIRDWGKLSFKNDYPIPSIGSHNVLVRIKAAAINPVDYKLPSIILGTVVASDFSGVIESVGVNVTKFAVGDEVYGKTNGSLADFCVAEVNDISLKPKNLSHSEAAAIPLTYLTSLQGLRDLGKLKKSGRVLIIGASGGCGIAALQLSRSMGASDIVAVCSGKNSELVRSHGATEVIDYQQHDLLRYFQPGSSDSIDDSLKFDVIYDAATGSGAGEDYKSKSMKLLRNEEEDREGGQYVAINGGPEIWIRQFIIGHKKQQNLVVYKFGNDSRDLEYLSKLAEDGWEEETGNRKHLAPVVGTLLPLTPENVKNGFQILKSRRSIGKIVFDLAGEQRS